MMWIILLTFLSTLQCGIKPSGVVFGAPNPDKHYKKSAFNELLSRQRVKKRRIRNDYSNLHSSPDYDRKALVHGCDIDEYWNATTLLCQQCTRCSHDNIKSGETWTLRGCGFDRDTECGTILDLQKKMNKLSRKQGSNSVRINTKARGRNNKTGRNHRSHKSSSDEEENIAYGYIVDHGTPSSDYANSFGNQANENNGQRRKVSLHHKLKEKVRNLSQDRNEFLKQIHEDSQIGLDNNDNYNYADEVVNNYGQVNYDYDYEPEEYEADYPIKEDGISLNIQVPSLHQEIAQIKNQLDKNPNEDSPKFGSTTPALNTFNESPYNMVNANKHKPTTERYAFNDDWTVNAEKSYTKYYHEDVYETTTEEIATQWQEELDKNVITSNIHGGHSLNVPDFIDGGDHNSEYGDIYKDDGITTENGVFGAVVKQPPKFGEMTDTLLEPVDLLGRWLNKNNSIA